MSSPTQNLLLKPVKKQKEPMQTGPDLEREIAQATTTAIVKKKKQPPPLLKTVKKPTKKKYNHHHRRNNHAFQRISLFWSSVHVIRHAHSIPSSLELDWFKKGLLQFSFRYSFWSSSVKKYLIQH
jgi:hypothetical protein